jgi:glutathione S-transferase
MVILGGTMKLYFSTTSPYVRKVFVSAMELGVYDRIERVACAAHPVNRDMNIVAHNPLGKIPTLISGDGKAIFDSRVICEYLHRLVPGFGLFPADSIDALVDQALADGLLDAALLGRTEAGLRPADKRWDAWTKVQMDKINSALDRFESQADGFADRIDIGTISAACAVSYLDFRYTDLDWRATRPGLAKWYARISERPSFQATKLG